MEIVPHEHQIRILESKARYIAAISGIQGGKTMTGAMWLTREITLHPKDDFLLAAPTYKILEQSTLKKFFEIFPVGAGVYKKQDSVFKLYGGGSIYIRSTEVPNNLEGMTVRAAWLDEAGLMKPRVWINAIARVSAKKGKILLTTTPYTLGWVYNDVVRPFQAGDEAFEVVKWRSIDNPYFPKEEYDRAQKMLSPEEFERRYNGEFRKMEGLVYPDWDAGIMTEQAAPSDNDIKEVFAGIDYGFSNPTSIQVVGLTKDNKLHVLDEVYQTKLTIDEIVARVKEMKEKWNIQMFYSDPSNPSLIESLNVNGCPTAAANNDVDYGIARVRQVIKNRRLKVWFGCYNLLDEIEVYHYNITNANEANTEYRNKPDKTFDHAVDALRYAIASHPLDIYDVTVEVKEDRRTEFWKRMSDKMEKRKLKIDRWGQDYSDEEVEIMEDLWI